MKTKTITTTNHGSAIAHWCPGCEEVHVIWTKRDEKVPGKGAIWDWNGDRDKPTTNPSVRVFDANGTTCHYFLRSGNIEFCGDCRHALAGQTVPLPDWPYDEGTYGGVNEG